MEGETNTEVADISKKKVQKCDKKLNIIFALVTAVRLLPKIVFRVF